MGPGLPNTIFGKSEPPPRATILRHQESARSQREVLGFSALLLSSRSDEERLANIVDHLTTPDFG
eukprot:1368217-Amphidinium_carterae.1